jgi:hypothetical protein
MSPKQVSIESKLDDIKHIQDLLSTCENMRIMFTARSVFAWHVTEGYSKDLVLFPSWLSEVIMLSFLTQLGTRNMSIPEFRSELDKIKERVLQGMIV